MKVVNFLERQWVVKFFGYALIIVPFLNILVHLIYLKSAQNLTWGQISVIQYLKSGSFTSYFLSGCSCLIGMTMLGGSTKAWKFVLILIAAHMGVQVMNYKSHVWQGPMAWATFIFNLSLFLFIADQLVWKYNSKILSAANAPKNIKIVQLKSYKKILFSFGSLKPWGRLVTLDQNKLIVNRIANPPQFIHEKTIKITFSQTLTLDIVFDREESNLIYFKPLDMTSDKVKNLNQWLRQIAV